jgi:arylsulfatase A
MPLHTRIDRRTFLKATAGAAVFAARAQQASTPNVVMIYADDLGYGDLGCYGSGIATPNIDRMAADGARFLNFYSASPVCSPSRAALLTGRYPTRVGVPRVIGQAEDTGLPDSETTMAQMLKSAGYKTICVGKWHLGATPQYLPTNRGFDEYYGIPYSNDMWPRPLMYNADVIEQPARLDMLTQRYTEQAVSFINRSKGSPFFLYMPHNYPHIPLAASARFHGKSGRGLYADVLQELDWSVGQVMAALKGNGLDGNTLVMFSSDNGPWWQGSQGKLRGRKGETYEGGMREPFIARFPGAIPGGLVSHGVASTMDILPTVARLCNAPLPGNPLDGIDIWPILSGQQDELDRDVFLYFDDVFLQCARLGQWKLHATRYNTRAWSPPPPTGRRNLPLPKPELYDLDNDPQESYDCASEHPDIVDDIMSRINRLLPTFPPAVQGAWRDTMGRRGVDAPDDGLPIDPEQ